MTDEIKFDPKYDKQGSYDPSDSEDDYSDTDKKLLDKIRKRNQQDSESEEELYGFSESDVEDNVKKAAIAESDVEGLESDNDLPDTKAWGNKKHTYYATDYVDDDYGGFGNKENAALMEEEEAKNIQKRLLEQLGDEDFSLEMFHQKTDPKENEKLIQSDLSELSKRQKVQLLEKESPEFAGLVDDFQNKLNVAKDDLQPVLKLVKEGALPHCPASKFVKTNYDLILNYCTNISFYLLLKSQKVNIQNHPVIKRLYQYRQILNKMEPIYLDVIKPQIDRILATISNNMQLHIINTESKDVTSAKKRKLEKAFIECAPKKLKIIGGLEKDDGEDTGVSDNEDDYDGVDYFNKESGSENVHKNQNESEESGFSDNDESELRDETPQELNKPSTSQFESNDLAEKRQITYQMAKNKGLTPHRKKEQRNPRVKHKLKFKKAKIRRKGAIREPRTEETRYAGEASGIKANVKKSIKIK